LRIDTRRKEEEREEEVERKKNTDSPFEGCQPKIQYNENERKEAKKEEEEKNSTYSNALCPTGLVQGSTAHSFLRTINFIIPSASLSHSPHLFILSVIAFSSEGSINRENK